MANLLVTGGAGFIGANFVRYWRTANPADTIVVLDALTYAGNRASLDGVDCIFVQGDINDTALVEQLLTTHAIDRIVHFAAESHVDRSISGPDVFLTTNIMGTHSLLKAARSVWQGRTDVLFHHISTDEVFGSLQPGDPAFSETTAYAPNSPYSASKASSDFLVRAYHHTYGLPVVTTNCSNNYGPYQFPEKLIPLIITNALDGKALPVYGDGLNIRDWLYVDDHARGIALAMERGTHGETYNVGGNNEWTNIDIVRLLCGLIDAAFTADATLAARFPACPAASGKNCDSLIIFVTDRAGHDRRYAIDATRARSALGYAPQETFETGIRKTLGWYLANESWWRPLQSKAKTA